jgi:murein DD-endopeptidase MepM/ murein hydrolase activator NlpD
VLHSRIVLSVLLVALATPARAADQEWSPPVDGPIVRGYEPPARPYGRQHVGIDYGAPPGTPVRAAGDGVVAFAGLVARSRTVAIEHPRARRTTYAYLRRLAVTPGKPVRRGDVLGFSGGTGPNHRPEVVHFGYRVNGQPQDPARLFETPPPRISLAPLDGPACRYTGRQPGRPRSEIHMPARSIGVRP